MAAVPIRQSNERVRARGKRSSIGILLCCTLAAMLAATATSLAQADDVLLSSLEISKARVSGNAEPQADKTVDGAKLTINGKTFDNGVAMPGGTVLFINLGGGSERFTATVGVDDAVPPAPANRRGGQGNRGGGGPQAVPGAIFRVLGDGRVLHETQVIRRGEAGVPISVDVKGIQTLVIIANGAGGGRGRGGGGGGGMFADWADAKLAVTGAKPTAIDGPSEEPYILTPKAGPEPRINGPVLTGITPGHPVLYKIPVTGTKPITYSVTNLPEGLTLDAATGIITGKIAEGGTYTVTFNAKNSVGSASKEFKFVAEGKLSLTPALGWNSWNVYAASISDELTRATADAFVTTGLIEHGWTYINLDDGWENQPAATGARRGRRGAGGAESPDAQEGRRGRRGRPGMDGPPRDADGKMLTNTKFPDMKALGDYIHAKGLKFGIYTGPGPTTCQQLEGSWLHEWQDFKLFADWGVDYIKYDWCGYTSILNGRERELIDSRQFDNPEALVVLKWPYHVGRKALDNVPRDIIYSLCQYGWGRVWEWGAEPGIEGNSWRTTGDITDTWQSMSSIGFQQVDLAKHAGPGHWNDPDMLVIGHLGWGPNPRPTRLTPNEQYTHITLWTLYSSPMLLGCDMTAIDEFTLSLCNNDEVLAVHQDPLGKTASRVAQQGNLEVWARPLADGSKAVGLFNRDEMPMKVTAKWNEIGVTGKQTVRDLWRQKDVGTVEGEFTTEVPRHGAMLLKISPPNERVAP